MQQESPLLLNLQTQINKIESNYKVNLIFKTTVKGTIMGEEKL